MLLNRAILVLVTLVLPAAVFSESLSQIPSPRPEGWSVDLTGELSQESLQEIDALIQTVNKSHGVEMAVVVIHSTQGRKHREFATELFNLWGIGDPQLNNGLLIFAALQDRRAEIILGDGIEDFESVTDDIMQNTTVAYFKAENPSRALLETTRACIERIYVDPEKPRTKISLLWSWFRESRLFQFGVPGFLLFVIFIGVRRYLRYRPRKCKKCGSPMRLLSEVEDDRFLLPFQKLEEDLKSVDYDVWACQGCFHTTKKEYNAWFSEYSECPQCQARTLRSKRTVLEQATYSSNGKAQIDKRCRHCEYHVTEFVKIAKRTQSSSSSSSSSSSGFSGGSSSGSGSSGSW